MTSHTFPEATLHFTHAGKLATTKAKLRPPLLPFRCHKVVSQCGVPLSQCYQTQCVPAGRTPAVGGDRRSSPARGPRQQQAAQRVVVGVAGTAANRSIGEVVQSRRRPLLGLGPSPG